MFMVGTTGTVALYKPPLTMLCQVLRMLDPEEEKKSPPVSHLISNYRIANNLHQLELKPHINRGRRQIWLAAPSRPLSNVIS